MSAPSVESGGESKRPSHGGRLDALDGLRTIAVMLVVLFHTKVPGMTSGFAGVDLFFVLSGYLITSGLLRGALGPRSPSLMSFWARRFKRLLPAAVIVCMTVLVWAVVGAPVYRRSALGGDLWWTSLYVANWHFIESAGYFAQESVPSPLLHMWSLAVEEQFYLIWPLLLVGTTAMLRSWRVSRAKVLAVLCGALVAVSAGLLSWLAGQGQVNRAYMGSDAKAFEPLLGALVAVLLTSERLRSGARRYAAVAGWAGAIGACVLLPFLGDAAGPTRLYFHGGALVFSMLVAGVIVALALGWVPGLSDVLALPPVSYLGRISYGIYLWHWPLTCWLLLDHEWSALLVVKVIAATVLLAALSYHGVEMPIRQGRLSAWLKPSRALTSSALVVAAVACAASVLGGTVLSPLATRVVTLPGARGKSVVLVVGDSVPQRLLPDLERAAKDRGLTLVSATAGGCSPLGLHTVIAPGDKDGERCAAEVGSKIDEAIQQYHPGTVVWWSRYELADRYDGNKLLAAGSAEFWSAQQRDLSAALKRFRADGAIPVLVLTDRPGVGMATRCTPASCHPFLRRLVDDDGLRVKWVDLERQSAREGLARTIAIDDVYCHDSKEPCDDRNASGVPVRADGSHFSDPAMRRTVADALLDRALAAARSTR